jgi:hypothetical protein
VWIDHRCDLWVEKKSTLASGTDGLMFVVT